MSYDKLPTLFRSFAFFLFHLTPLLIFWSGVSLGSALFGLGMYSMMVFGITAGYHRYFSHRTYKTSRVFQFVLALMGTLALQKGIMWWAANHRDHHRYSDKPEDIHSPVQEGFWWSHIGWIISDKFVETRWNRVKDFIQYKELKLLNTYWIFVYALFCIAIFALLGFQYLVWGCFVPVVLCWHMTFCVNSICHLFGYKRYKLSDESRNNPLVAIATFGEGWHQNHHYYPASARQGFKWYEIDVTYYILVLLETLGIVWDVSRPPHKVVHNEDKLIKPGPPI
jgi:stearoyl-CoA desaturase (delta-9 desaturase)